MAPRIVVVSPDPPGVPGVEWRREPRCSEGEVLLLHPRAPRPDGPCAWARVPHRGLLERVVGLVSGGLEPGDAVLRAALEAVEESLRVYKPAWSLRGLEPPGRPPPVHVWAYAYHGEEGVDRALHLAHLGVQALVYGAGRGDREGYLAALRRLASESPVPVLADPGGAAGPVEAYEAGAAGYMSLDPGGLEGVPEWLRGSMAFVLVPSSLGPGEERARGLAGAARRAEGLGYRFLVLDPVMQPLARPGALESLVAARLLSRSTRHPIMLGIVNVYELLDADTQGSIPVLAALAAEAGASVLLAGEHSWKSRGAVLESLVAAAMVSAALRLGGPPKDLPVRLLPWKGKGRGYP